MSTSVEKLSTSRILSFLAVYCTLATLASSLKAQVNGSQADEYQYSAPYTHKNLSIFLISAKEHRSDISYRSLKEAMDDNKLTVYETGTVGELAIKNGAKEAVFIQSGDIVKGGKQDRTLAYDLILPAHSQKTPIKSFCVESGRWKQRGEEGSSSFSSSNDALVSRELRMAAKHEGEQSKVWSRVAKAQAKLAANTGGTVNDAASPSSLQLSIETGAVQKSTDEYLAKLEKIIEGKKDVIGFVFYINGEFNTADIYSSHSLFAKMWPKLIKAAAIEAVAEQTKDEHPEPSLGTFTLRRSEVSQQTGKEQIINERTRMITKETKQVVLFETKDEALGSWVHRNYMEKRDTDNEETPEDGRNQRYNIQELNPPVNIIR